MKTLGYRSPRHYKVCCGRDHSTLLTSQETHPVCCVCDQAWAECIDYYVVGLNFGDWFKTDQQCQALLEHWEDSITSLGQPDDYDHPEKTELWHGRRFRELAYFWDPSQSTLLPALCPCCSAIVAASEIAAACICDDSVSSSSTVTVTYDSCAESFSTQPKYMKGDPRNQALLIHYDGWCPHTTSSGSVAAITLTHGCTNKVNRSHGENALVYSFIPVSQLPEKSPHKYDTFLEPLVDELASLYINGQQVFYKSSVEGYCGRDDTPTLRALPLLLTADLKAHTEVGLTGAGGFKGCRRCHLEGEYLRECSHYYYGQFQYTFRFPAPLRTAADNLRLARQVDAAATAAERTRLSKAAGVTGETILYRLYDLCRFDPVRDLVVNVMHSLVLNLIRSEMENHLLRGADSRSPGCSAPLSRSDLAAALEKVPWYSELRDGRIPKVSSTVADSSRIHKLGYWKAEEFGKFAVVAPYILREIVPEESYRCFCLLSQIYQLVFSKELRIQGWDQQHQEMLKRLLWKLHIEYEHLYGLSACTENVEYSLHIPKDIERFSLPDNYWCYMYERQVKFYKKQTTNMKSLCKTFADRAAQLSFTKSYLATRGSEQEASRFDLVQISQKPVLLQAKSHSEAIQLKEHIGQHDLSPEVCCAYENGIMLGAPRFVILTDRQLRDIRHWVSTLEPGKQLPDSLPSVASSYPRSLKTSPFDLATVFRREEYVVVTDFDEPAQEWAMQLSEFLVYGPVFDRYYYFIDGSYFVAKTIHGEVARDPWTKQPWMVRRQFERLRIQPMKQISRKVMLFPDIRNNEQYMTIDPDGPVRIQKVSVPIYPKPNEVVKFRSPTQTKCMLVKEVNGSRFRGSRLRRVRGRNPRWVGADDVEVDARDIMATVQYTSNCGCFILQPE